MTSNGILLMRESLMVDREEALAGWRLRSLSDPLAARSGAATRWRVVIPSEMRWTGSATHEFPPLRADAIFFAGDVIYEIGCNPLLSKDMVMESIAIRSRDSPE